MTMEAPCPGVHGFLDSVKFVSQMSYLEAQGIYSSFFSNWTTVGTYIRPFLETK